jgi:hypothetical protein
MSWTPPTCSVAAVVIIIAIAIALENAIPTIVSARIRPSSLFSVEASRLSGFLSLSIR